MKSNQWNDVRDGTTSSSGIRSRRHTTIQIRKQQREEVLRRKRGITGMLKVLPTTTTSSSNSSSNSITTSSITPEAFRDILTSYCTTSTPTATTTASAATTLPFLYDAMVTTSSSSSSSSSTMVMDTIRSAIRENCHVYGVQFLRRLLSDLQQPQPPQQQEMVATILVELTCTSLNDENDHDDDPSLDYYRDMTTTTTTTLRLPHHWYELLDDRFGMKSHDHTTMMMSHTPNYHSALQIIFQVLQTHNNNNNDNTTSPPTTTTTPSTPRTVELLCHFLGNLLASPPSVSMLLVDYSSPPSSSSSNPFLNTLIQEPYWSTLFSSTLLPHSTYCCACVVRMEPVHEARYFLTSSLVQKKSSPCKNDETTILATFRQVLGRRNERISVEMAWILEGLTRREVEGVYLLLSMSAATTTEPNHTRHDNYHNTVPTKTTESMLLVTTLIEEMHYHTQQIVTRPSTTTASSSSSSSSSQYEISKSFIVPALRTLCHIIEALEDRCLDFLSSSSQLLMDTIHVLLEHAVVLEALDVAVALCVVAVTTTTTTRHHSHVAVDPNGTTIRSSSSSSCHLSHWIPRFVQLLTNPSSRHEWKQESLFCLVHVVLDHCPDPAMRQWILQEFVWQVVSHSDLPHQQQQQQGDYYHHALLESLVDALQQPDGQVVRAALQLLNAILRSIAESRTVFMTTTNGIEVLNHLCGGCCSSSTDDCYDESTLDLAVQLLEDYFEMDEDDDEDDNNNNNTGNHHHHHHHRDEDDHHMSFATTTTTTTGAFFGISNPEEHVVSVGRGRERVRPAWMTPPSSK